jgi:hypothetical protein
MSINPLRRIPADCLSSHPSAGHSDVDKTTIPIPDCVDPSTECRDRTIRPIGERVNRSMA